ncbi:toprim domain-containing protein [Granulosicoccaceae sp. 1_MG-2023]|nr:toprim domain-containing protein [Granulosicoccaceae sp. 1_MG-2023]
MFPDLQGGVVGDFSTGLTAFWRADNTDAEMTPAELERQRQAIQQAIRQRQAEDAERHRVAALEAAEQLKQAKPATNNHPYLRRKGVQAHGIYVSGDSLLIPLRDINGRIQSLQTIQPDGGKRFLRGGKVRGGFYLIGAFDPRGEVLASEGWATGATLREATGKAVAVCFNAGNLLPVCEAIRRRFRHMRITVCADNDRFTPGNPGLVKAREAALAVGGGLLVPEFPPECEGGTDFNDLQAWHRAKGGELCLA